MNGNDEKFLEKAPMPQSDEIGEIKTIQEVFNTYGYGLVSLKYFIITILVLMCYGLHLSVYAMMAGPMIIVYQLTPIEQKIASSIVFLGLAIGSILLGSIKEAKKHRKSVIVTFSLLLTLLHLLITLVYDPYVFIITRFFIGACIGIILPGSYALLVEYLPVRNRSLVLIFSWLMYPVGRIFLSTTMLEFMPNFEPEMVRTILLIQLVIPGLTCLLSLALLKDSPRNLIIIGKATEAYEILDGLLGRPLTQKERSNIAEEIYLGINQSLDGTFKDLFGRKLIRSTLCLMGVWCVHGFIFYGTLLTSNLTMIALGQATKDKRQIIINQIIIAAELVGPMILIGVMTEFKILGRIKTLFITYFLAFVFMILCPILPDYFAILYGISASFMGAGNCLSSSYASEIYPTKIRESGLSFLYFVSRVSVASSQVVFLYINDVSIFFPYYLSIGLFGIILLSILLLPFETHSKPIDQDFGKKNLTVHDIDI
jgi:MFS family permease